MSYKVNDTPPLPIDEEICDFCELDPYTNYGSPDNPYFCEGNRCNNAINNFQDEFYNNFIIKERKQVLNAK